MTFSAPPAPVVLDASLAVEQIVQTAPRGAAQWVEWIDAQRTRLVPWHFWPEVANAMLVGNPARADPGAPGDRPPPRRGRRQRRATGERRLIEAIGLASQHRLSVYDALYVQTGHRDGRHAGQRSTGDAPGRRGRGRGDRGPGLDSGHGPPAVRGGQPHQRPDPRVHRADQAAHRPSRAPGPGCRPRRWPRRTCSTRPGSSGCAGSASSRARAGSSRPPSTAASRTAWVSCTRRACGPGALPSLRSAPRGHAGRRRGLGGSHPLGGARRRDGARGGPPPRRRPRALRPLLRRARPVGIPRAAASRAATRPSGSRHEDLGQAIVERELAPHHRAACAARRRSKRSGRPSPRARSIEPALDRLPHLQAAASRTRPCRSGSAGCSRSSAASSRSTTSTTSGVTPT